jgi:hypothetical protein
MKKLLLLSGLLLLLASCQGPAQEKEVVNSYQVEKLFSYKGHDVCRFKDGTADTVYFVVPGPALIQHSYSDGDNNKITIRSVTAEKCNTTK